MKKELTISGINSVKCAERLSGVLYSMPEIEDVIIDIENNTIILELNLNISSEMLKTIIKSAGKYEVIDIK